LTYLQTESHIRELKNLPTLSSVAGQALQLAADDSATFERLAELVKSDPAISLKLLRIANSASRGLSQPVTSVERAIRLLGLEAVKSAILSIQVLDIMKSSGKHNKDRELWIHSLAVATMCRFIAEKTAAADPEVAFAVGLLHDMGKIALASSADVGYLECVGDIEEAEEPLLDAEKRIFGFHHTEAGKILAEKWGLSELLINCIWLHHQPIDTVDAPGASTAFIRLLTAADILCRRQDVGFSGNWMFTESAESLLEPLGITSEIIAEITQAFGAEFEQRASVYDLDVDSTKIYYSAMQKANAKLGRIYEQIDEMKLDLEIRATGFDNLHKMNLELGLGLSMEETLGIIGSHAISSFGIQKVIAFVVDESKKVLFGKIVDSQGGMENLYIKTDANIDEGNEETKNEPFISELAARLAGAENPPRVITGADKGLLPSEILLLPLDLKGGASGGVLVDARKPDDTVPHRRTTLAEWLPFTDAASVATERVLLREQVSTHIQNLLDLQRRAKEMEAEIIKNKKLAALGRVAAGAAHEMNNPLTIISGRAQMLTSKESNASRKKMLNVIVEQCGRLSRIISDLLNYARPMPPNNKSFDLVKAIRGILELNGEMLAQKKIKLETSFPKHAPIIGDSAQIDQVVTNILLNAIQACEIGGEIGVAVNINIKREETRIIVTDNGKGIPAENLERIFEPFFTTKEPGSGTGLGLSISHSIVKSHGGRIVVRSAVNKGCQFIIQLPQSNKKQQEQQE